MPQGPGIPRRPPASLDWPPEPERRGSEPAAHEEKGQHSNPGSRQAQRRLKPAEIDDLVAAYLAGDLVRDIAARHGVNRTTVISHITRRDVPRRSEIGWTQSELRAAEAMYARGSSLATVGTHFGIDASTVANRFRRAGVPIRPRRGWTPSVGDAGRSS